MATGPEPRGFLSRWSQRKTQLRQGVVPAEPPPPTAVQPAVQPVPSVSQPAARPATSPAASPAAVAPPPAVLAATPPAPMAPTLADVAALTHDSDYSRFVAPGVDTGVKNAALKQLFTDPQFNLMDGLDTYIDDYGRPDPLPEGMLRQMAQSQFLGLFADDTPEDALTADAPDPLPLAQAPPDEDAALRLQPHDAPGPASPAEGPGPDAGRQR